MHREVAFQDENEERKVLSHLEGIIKFYLDDRPEQRERAKDIILFLLGEGITTSENTRTGTEITRHFKDRHPQTSIYNTINRLEVIGLLDRKTKYDGYYLSHKFINELERQRNNWKKVLDIAERKRLSI